MKGARELLLEFAANPFVERIGRGVSAEKQQELHDKIISGEIDIGPLADHTTPVKDIRPIVDGETAWLFFKTGKIEWAEMGIGTASVDWLKEELEKFNARTNGTKPE